jgi:2-haloalkanoic acid dehalogenase type II
MAKLISVIAKIVGACLMIGRYNAVLFDLLTALVDSGALWNRIAANDTDGGRWRAAYLRLTYSLGRYRAYETVVAEAAEAVGLPRSLADDLTAGYGTLEPWPEAPYVLQVLGSALPLGIVTNCSERLGRIAAARTGGDFTVVVTAERAGFYKPHPQPYQLALDALRTTPERCLFVAGSPYDLFGTSKLGLPTYWHDRTGTTAPPDTPPPLWHEKSLKPVLKLLGVATTASR